MNRIKCVNRGCPNPDVSRVFEWDDESLQVVDRNTPFAKSYIVNCPFCNERNKIFVKGVIPLDVGVAAKIGSADSLLDTISSVSIDILRWISNRR